ncbi:MAG: MFS transporter [Alphaproteobacteria bacterium]|nr:MFS transporter [Alphaproteobacteria bacterium]
MRLLPFADSATKALPLSRLLRLALFQISVGMAAVLLTATLNRVMIVELSVPGTLVAIMVALPVLAAPLRALIGHRSDTHVSALGWRRAPFIWFGSLLQFGGFAIMPFALLILSGDTHGPAWVGQAAAALAFVLVGLGMHTTQTAGLALAADLAAPEHRPRVVALLYVMLLVGMLVSALLLGWLLADFSALRLIQVIQGAAIATMALNIAALWKQEARDPNRTALGRARASFANEWRALTGTRGVPRLLTAAGLGAAGFAMQDVLLEPYGAEVLGLDVSATTMLTALWACGMLAGFTWAARALSRSGEPHRLAGFGALIGASAFALILLAAPLHAGAVFSCGVFGIGVGAGLFSVGTLTAVMAITEEQQAGIALGVWGAVNATAVGVAIMIGGVVRDVVAHAAAGGALGAALNTPAAGYSAVYLIELVILFAAIIAIGPLARHAPDASRRHKRFGLAEFPT